MCARGRLRPPTAAGHVVPAAALCLAAAAGLPRAYPVAAVTAASPTRLSSMRLAALLLLLGAAAAPASAAPVYCESLVTPGCSECMRDPVDGRNKVWCSQNTNQMGRASGVGVVCRHVHALLVRMRAWEWWRSAVRQLPPRRCALLLRRRPPPLPPFVATTRPLSPLAPVASPVQCFYCRHTHSPIWTRSGDKYTLAQCRALLSSTGAAACNAAAVGPNCMLCERASGFSRNRCIKCNDGWGFDASATGAAAPKVWQLPAMCSAAPRCTARGVSAAQCRERSPRRLAALLPQCTVNIKATDAKGPTAAAVAGCRNSAMNAQCAGTPAAAGLSVAACVLFGGAVDTQDGGMGC